MTRANAKKITTGPLLELARRILFVTLLCLTLWCAAPAASAQPAPELDLDTPTLTTQPEAEPQSMAPGLWLYLMASGLALLMFGLYLLRRARQQRLLELASVEEPLLLSPPRMREAPAEADLRAVLAQAVATDRGAAPNALALQTIEDTPLFAARGDGHSKECPQCHRKYASWMVVCPFDAATLQDLHARRRPARVPRGHTALPRKRCPSCSRRFEEDAICCPYDATELVQDTIEEASSATPFTICRVCGRDIDGDEDAACGCGEERDVFTLDPSNTDARAPTMPLTRCPRCRTYGALGQTHCPGDGELLLPVTSVQANALPSTGYGARRKLCRKCGTRYSGAYVHCALDGTKLTPIQ